LLLLERTKRIENRPTVHGLREDAHYYAISGDPS